MNGPVPCCLINEKTEDRTGLMSRFQTLKDKRYEWE